MFRKLFIVLALLWATPIAAQNTTCATRAPGDYTNACASTAFIGQMRYGNTNKTATIAGTLTNGNCVSIDSSGNLVDAGVTCNGSSGSGTVTSASKGQFGFYGADGTTVSGSPLSIAANNTALSALSSTSNTQVLRLGQATQGDGPPLTYLSSNAACSLNAGAGDGGSQVPSSDGKCWLVVPPTTGVPIQAWDASCGVYSHTCSAAIAAAAAYSTASNGIPILFPTGCYATAPFTLGAEAAFIGAVSGKIGGQYTSVPCTSTSTVQGATFMVTATTPAFATLSGYGATISGFAFWYPNQIQPTGTTPTAYQPTVVLAGGQDKAENLMCVNCYDFIDISIGRVFVNNIMSGAIDRDLIIDGPQDFVYIDTLNHTPFYDLVYGASFPSTIDNWVMTNSVFIQIARADGVRLSNAGAYARAQCLQLSDGATGNSFGSATNLYCDSVSYGIVASSTNNTTAGGWNVTNLQIVAQVSGFGTVAEYGVLLNTGGTAAPHVKLSNCSVVGTWAGAGQQVRAGQLSLGSFSAVTSTGSSTLTDCAW